jgi:arylsulfatase A-like enzyme
VLPTLCAAAGVTVPTNAKVDGIDLLPHMANRKTPVERAIVFWQMDLYKHLQRHYPKPKPYSTEVARKGKWKLLALEGKPQELFDIQADPFEKKNLIDDRPEIVRELAKQLKAWLAEPRLSPFGD